MSLRQKRREGEVDPFYDMLFNILIAFVFCFIIALLAMNPKAKKEGDIPAKAEFIKQKHEEKAKVDTSSSNIIAGRSLQVTYIDSKGVTRRAVVPDGQKFKLEDVTFTKPGGKVERPSPWASLSPSFRLCLSCAGRSISSRAMASPSSAGGESSSAPSPSPCFRWASRSDRNSY